MKYIALLRGVNVGGNNKVDMRLLKICFEKIGFQNAITYINSGNVLFDTDETDVGGMIKKCEEAMEKEFGFPVGLAIVSADSLKAALEHAPEWWGDEKESKHNIIFVIPPATADKVVTDAGSIKPEYEQLFVYDQIIFWSAPIKTFSRTRWSKVVGTNVYKSITIRNANTARRLLELALY